jgi:GT2 family glycosyltransferase
MDAQRFRDEQRALRELVGRRRRQSGAQSDVGLTTAAPSRGGAGEPIDGPLVSVIVVCWNAAAVLERCLDRLFAQDYADREIIVVDDGSTDATAKIARAASARGELTLVESSRNRGCPSARNLGLACARGEIVAFIDADGFAAPSWLSGIVRAFAADRATGGVASTVFYDDSPMIINGAGGTVNRQGWAADLSMNESFEFAQLAGEVLYPMGCGMAIRREALERVGPFDDRMLNYYDDVDYGMRLWRAGYKVCVAADAWIDHGAAAGDSTLKRLLCERHRMRVVLKHSSVGTLVRWGMWELRELLNAPRPVRAQKLRAIAWNVRRLPSSIAARWRLREAPRVPAGLIDASWGDGYPAGVPLRPRPRPRGAGAAIDMAHAEGELLYGWFPAERIGSRDFRWAARSAAVLVHLDQPVELMRLEYAHLPVDVGGVDVRVRRVEPGRSLAVTWCTRLTWQYLARSVENHPVSLAPGDYEVVFASARGWSDPPRETRCLAVALSRLSFASTFDVSPGGLDMADPAAEAQLVNGWFELEDGPRGGFRWGAARAAAVVRLTEPAHLARLDYRLPPGSVGSLRVALTSLSGSHEVWSEVLPWLDTGWREDAFEIDVPAGDYLLSFDTQSTWANPAGRDPNASPENRSLGFALSSFALIATR